jgi:hypothetical protein
MACHQPVALSSVCERSESTNSPKVGSTHSRAITTMTTPTTEPPRRLAKRAVHVIVDPFAAAGY